MRIRQEPAVGHQVGVQRQTVLVAEGDHRRVQAVPARLAERGVNLGPQLVDVEIGGVQDQVRLAAQLRQQRALTADAVDHPSVALERMRPADVVEPADQRLVRGLQKEHLRMHATGLERVQRRAQVGEERPAADVHDHGDAIDRAL